MQSGSWKVKVKDLWWTIFHSGFSAGGTTRVFFDLAFWQRTALRHKEKRSVKSLCTVASANAGPVQKILPESAMRRRDESSAELDVRSMAFAAYMKSSAQIDVRSTAFAAYLAQGP
eukprot:g45047.t1